MNEQNILPLVKEDLRERVDTGEEEYGERINTSQDFDSLEYLYEELLDSVLYLRKLIAERNNDNDPKSESMGYDHRYLSGRRNVGRNAYLRDRAAPAD